LPQAGNLDGLLPQGAGWYSANVENSVPWTALSGRHAADAKPAPEEPAYAWVTRPEVLLL